MAAALRSLALVDAPRRVAVLGEMAELGEAAAGRPPARWATWRRSLGIEVVAVGGAPYGGTAVATQDEALRLVEAPPARQRGAGQGQPLGGPRPAGRRVCADGVAVR